MTKQRRRNIEVFSLSCLDAISCGFGALILLLMIVLAAQPRTTQLVEADLRAKIARMVSAREQLLAQKAERPHEVAASRTPPSSLPPATATPAPKAPPAPAPVPAAPASAAIASAHARLEQATRELDAAGQRRAEAHRHADEQTKREAELQVVKQTLSEEMKRLLAQPAYKPPSKDATIAGVPVDSEYIVFIIDTSGSMQQGAWPLVVRKMEEVLSVHPEVKGLQVINDTGRYMFTQYAGQWIQDTPARRKAIIDRLRNWQAFSSSSPVDGIVHAVRQFGKDEKRVSLYVFGDDFSSGNLNDVVAEVARINARGAGGAPRVRIHAFGFPVLFLDDRGRANRIRFAHLMRVLAEQNAGAFVGLPSLK
jgi:hypothetical protein